MSALVVLCGVLLLSIPVIAARSGLGPDVKVQMSCVAIATGLFVMSFGLVVASSPLIIVWHDGEQIGGLSHVSPGGRLAWVAGAALLLIVVIVTTDAVRVTTSLRRRVRAASLVTSGFDHGRHNVKVRLLPTEQFAAFAVAAPNPHVVVSQALYDSLTPEVFNAVVAHEAAHLRLRHDRHLFLLSLYSRFGGWAPGIEGTVDQLRGDIEKWADRHAVQAGTTDTGSLSTAIGKISESTGNGLERIANLGLRPSRPRARERVALATAAVTPLLGSAYATVHSVFDLGMIIAAVH